MRLSTGVKIATLLACLVLMASTVASSAGPPNPILNFMGQEDYETGGKQWTRYKYSVVNRGEYRNEMFAPAPALPACGQNTKSSRTWVDLYDQKGKRLNGFCAFTKNEELDKLWFALEKGTMPPSWIYIELNDRQTSTKYKSNLAETTY